MAHQPGQAAQGHTGHAHGAMHYVKIWALLLVLLVVSIVGPMLGNKVLTIITAFGIAVVKALIVAAFFMHLNVEKRYIWQLLIAMLLLVALFFAGAAPDVMKFSGQNWLKTLAAQYEEVFRTDAAKHSSEHGK